jgi:multidrug efflux pump
MSMSKFFINRPIFASVISIIIVIAGLVASRVLPIAQYPQIAPPTVLITATYPGRFGRNAGQNRGRAD